MSETVTFTLNEKDITVPRGWTVMQAARKEKVNIPHFCWHPGLSVAGVCRFCMVHVEGARKLEIACNLEARDGMVVRTDLDEVKEAHKWALEFHLVNHPLDCPVCDQAGECGLQDYYMGVGRYKSQMTRPKVLKPKTIDAGTRLVLDTERCILCSRCVRFEEEVTQSGALGIFDRGDRAIIGTYEGETITHNYQENLVDICPVGAFTSKQFRFKQRVWFLKEKEAVCPGCSTGCRVSVHGKPDIRRYFRVKPVECESVNGAWMCDQGRQIHQHLNPEHRLASAMILKESGQTFPGRREAIRELAAQIKETGPEHTGLLVAAQYTNEEYLAFLSYFVHDLGINRLWLWRDPDEKRHDFDGILLRGDRNANTTGLTRLLGDFPGLEKEAIRDETADCVAARPELLIALCPELPGSIPGLQEQLRALATLPKVSLWGLHHGLMLQEFWHLQPTKGFAEKSGTFINQAGEEGKLNQPFPAAVSDAMDVTEIISELKQ